jgi:glycosyltransferase involved in cell wall biosynthesis
MRVLHIIDSGGMYGAEVMLLNLLDKQIQQGLKPVIASIGNHGCREKAIEAEARKRNFAVKAFRMHPGPNFIGAWEILQYAKSTDCALLHSHGYRGNILFGFIPQSIRRLPLITTVHGWTSTGTTFTRMRLYEWLDSLTLSRMDAVVLVNKGMLAHPKIGGRKTVNFHVINNGISVDEPDTCPCDALKFLSATGLKIVAVGRFSPEKGFDVLLKALAHVVESGGDVSLVLFGEGGERRKLQELAGQLGLRKRVKMPGFMGNIAAAFSCFDFLVMPSLTEGLPITLLEAMRAKVPIIATSVGGIPHVLQNKISGILVEPRDIDGLVKAINKVANNEKLRTYLTENASQTFQKYYTSDKMALAYKTVYKQVVRSMAE